MIPLTGSPVRRVAASSSAPLQYGRAPGLVLAQHESAAD
jgi:hypothetical protein